MKKTLGKQKIEIKKIEKQSRRQVTFSKRRVGLFKKASELCILTGAEIAIVVNSLGNRVFTFGHPNVDAVVDRFLGGESLETHAPSGNTSYLDRELAVSFRELEAERNLIEGVKTVEGYGGDTCWWNEAVEGKGLEELEHYGAALEELMRNVTKRADELQSWSSNSSPAPEGMVFQDSDVEAGDESVLIPNQTLFDYEDIFNF
ncbi:hypothetical protein CASFOL_004680 [Castilleja foliolosa]|uniref:MADS-box domain-containing protein n=1 Tax=Castilleja foliolosa TaxID=1961234 RepID=A0ABD3EBF2_9LAMI